METEKYLKNLAIARGNEKRIAELKKKKHTKRNKLACYMLSGWSVTGAVMIEMFHILSYRDAIYDLKKAGFNISSKTIIEANGIPHVVWWMSEFDEEFALERQLNVFGYCKC